MYLLFPTSQVRVVRFYVSLLVLFVLVLPRPCICYLRSLPDLHRDRLRSVSLAGPPPPSFVPCRTSTATICAQCSLPDLNHGILHAVFRAGPQPRPCVLSAPCRASTAGVCAQSSVPDLNLGFRAGTSRWNSARSVPCRTSTATICLNGLLAC